MFPIPPTLLTVDLPKIITPPQSPLALEPVSLLEVNTIGLVEVPTAFIFAPLVMIKDELATVASPKITVPGWMVNVAPFTYTKPEIK